MQPLDEHLLRKKLSSPFDRLILAALPPEISLPSRNYLFNTSHTSHKRKNVVHGEMMRLGADTRHRIFLQIPTHNHGRRLLVPWIRHQSSWQCRRGQWFECRDAVVAGPNLLRRRHPTGASSLQDPLAALRLPEQGHIAPRHKVTTILPICWFDSM